MLLEAVQSVLSCNVGRGRSPWLSSDAFPFIPSSGTFAMDELKMHVCILSTDSWLNKSYNYLSINDLKY